MTALAFVLVVTDGATLRTIYPAAMGGHAARIERIVRQLIDLPRAELEKVPRPQNPLRPDTIDNPTLTHGEMARASGYSGDCCQSCGMFTMKRSGTCLTCVAAGRPQGAAHEGGCTPYGLYGPPYRGDPVPYTPYSDAGLYAPSETVQEAYVHRTPYNFEMYDRVERC